MVLLVLAVLWGIVLVPPALRNRREARQSRSVENFRKRLEVLAPPSVPRASRPPSAVRPAGSAPPRMAAVAEPGPPLPPARTGRRPAAAGWNPSRAEVLRRRRQVFGTLCGAAVLTLVLAVAVAGLRPVFGATHLLVDAALVAYVAGLRRLRLLARERADKVRYLPVAVAIPVPMPDAGSVAETPAARSAAL